MRDTTAVAVLCVAGILTATPAYAYIDPGTGGLLVQLLTGGVAGALILGRLYWHRIRTALGFSTGDANPPEGASGPSRDRG